MNQGNSHDHASDPGVSGHFQATHGVDYHIDRLIETRLKNMQLEVLREYRREMQYARGRALMQNPLDYKAVRKLDRELEDVSAFLLQLEMLQSQIA